MVKRLFLLVALIALICPVWALSNTVLTYSHGRCTDSDGSNPFNRGSVSSFYKDRAYYYVDSCADDRTVNEWTCKFMGSEESALYSCPTGYICRDGACSLANMSLYAAPRLTCIDPDGLNTDTLSTAVTYLYEYELYSATDACSGLYAVSEAYCEKDSRGHHGKYKRIPCAEGSYCINGSCVKEVNKTPAAVYAAAPKGPPLIVSRQLAHVADSGSQISVFLSASRDSDQALCAYGVSERVPFGWEITGVSYPGRIGRPPGNGSVRLSDAVRALNMLCAGNITAAEAQDALSEWGDYGISPGYAEWIFWNPSGNASGANMSYTVTIPLNASLNSEFYGDHTWDGERYRRTLGNYRMIISSTVTTTTTTTTSLPQVMVAGIAYLSDRMLPLAGADVTASCTEQGGGMNSTKTNSYGYYSVEVLCPYGSQVSVSAQARGGEICGGQDYCMSYGYLSGSANGTVIYPGYARIDVALSDIRS